VSVSWLKIVRWKDRQELRIAKRETGLKAVINICLQDVFSVTLCVTPCMFLHSVYFPTNALRDAIYITHIKKLPTYIFFTHQQMHFY